MKMLFRKSALSVKPLIGFIVFLLIVGAVLPVAARQDDSATVGTTDCSVDTRSDTAIIEFELDVFYRRGRDVTVAAWARLAADETLIESEDPDFADRDGYIATGDTVELLYDNAHWDAFHLELPFSVFPRGDYDVYMEIEVFDENDNVLLIYNAYDCSFSIGDGDSGGSNNNNGNGGDVKGGGTNSGGGTSDCESTIALDCSLEPDDGADALEGNFRPDPFDVRVNAGGDIAVEPEFVEGSTCKGFVNDAPNFVLEYTDAGSYLRFYTEEEDDLTMIVLAPDDLWYCDDDTGDGYNPEVSFVNSPDGFYYVWVGTYSEGDSARATLLISEDEAN